MKCLYPKASALLVFLLLVATAATAQFTATGNVKDDAGQPLVGVTVLAKGTTIGTASDLDGNFSLQLPGESANLQFSYTGFKSRELTVTTT